jgi:hypothetical protein
MRLTPQLEAESRQFTHNLVHEYKKETVVFSKVFPHVHVACGGGGVPTPFGRQPTEHGIQVMT